MQTKPKGSTVEYVANDSDGMNDLKNDLKNAVSSTEALKTKLFHKDLKNDAESLQIKQNIGETFPRSMGDSTGGSVERT